jgi:hypothetical protein
MTQPDLQEQYDPEAVEDYRQQARYFLGKGREYLAEGDLHQASEKGWGAAAWMAKAVAVAQGWDYREHAQFGVVLRNASDLTGNDRLLDLSAIAYGLHRGYYTRKRFLSDRSIARNLDQMAELIDTLEPLTVPSNGQASD